MEAGSKKRKWIGTEEVQGRNQIELHRCTWDVQCQYGQTRCIGQGYVVRLKAILEERPTTAPVRVSVWENTADRQYYSRSGLHVGVQSRISGTNGISTGGLPSGGTPMCARTFSSVRLRCGCGNGSPAAAATPTRAVIGRRVAGSTYDRC